MEATIAFAAANLVVPVGDSLDLLAALRTMIVTVE